MTQKFTKGLNRFTKDLGSQDPEEFAADVDVTPDPFAENDSDGIFAVRNGILPDSLACMLLDGQGKEDEGDDGDPFALIGLRIKGSIFPAEEEKRADVFFLLAPNMAVDVVMTILETAREMATSKNPQHKQVGLRMLTQLVNEMGKSGLG